MKSDLLLRIRDAESAASEQVAKAEEEAAKLVADARRQAEKTVAEGRAKADQAYQDRIAEARAAFAEAEKKAIASGKRQATTLRKKFDGGIDGAVDRVLELFEESL